jgi:hypothetical protein
VILAGVATLEEIEDRWTLIDVVRANEVLDVKAEVEARERSKRDNRNGDS